ncbi:hypothetical protein DSCA_05650 [Desulfosarcina alkanivorans]|uniref:TIR domain-containing protein n=1 Tax=Desulfosarcina alkanivorans TaxID=571177 RepID=A0A5K7YDW4_9BACT|nr:TIR domain-containing protein [Desulfosarcina alkanivorans]BBO66635.1 hypothetical protein DSCA_05650 [Desulfosarcina alkanivorans]
MKKYQIALSFAGEDRDYVEKVATILREKGVNVFYDKFEETKLWGKNLYTYLSDIYQNKALFTVIFVSKAYRDKMWTNHERESAQARAFTESKEYILPAMFDNTIEIPGLLKTTGYIDLNDLSPNDFAIKIIGKLKNEGSMSTSETSKPKTNSPGFIHPEKDLKKIIAEDELFDRYFSTDDETKGLIKNFGIQYHQYSKKSVQEEITLHYSFPLMTRALTMPSCLYFLKNGFERWSQSYRFFKVKPDDGIKIGKGYQILEEFNKTPWILVHYKYSGASYPYLKLFFLRKHENYNTSNAQYLTIHARPFERNSTKITLEYRHCFKPSILNYLFDQLDKIFDKQKTFENINGPNLSRNLKTMAKAIDKFAYNIFHFKKLLIYESEDTPYWQEYIGGGDGFIYYYRKHSRGTLMVRLASQVPEINTQKQGS